MNNILPSYQDVTSFCRNTQRNVRKNATFL